MINKRIKVLRDVTKTKTYKIIYLIAGWFLLPFSLISGTLMFIGDCAEKLDDLLYRIHDRIIRITLLLIGCDGVEIVTEDKAIEGENICKSCGKDADCYCKYPKDQRREKKGECKDYKSYADCIKEW